MIEGIIDAVRQAEEEAKHIAADSQRDAREAARAVTDQANEQAALRLEQARAQVQERIDKAQAQAQEEAAAYVQAQNEQINGQRERAQARVDAAVALVLERIPAVWR
ncbi:MAG: hypothetical protein IJN00_05625 [Clostridia bacterium]|nr:hypothetical protein [Clostridia bacterium]